ncbi:MAG: hypothetical protein Q7T36_03985 [Fluviicoccus sp.]|uniref:hypothetical protein n=1 Tax=Fluviicoccus sp. TaxID=2003552 RepID=UPI00271CA99F|nr:hypothetical protein [Fluviicoccus sp.]MDO8329610.1 hypothetical protein [Fluviicoccus sp.]
MRKSLQISPLSEWKNSADVLPAEINKLINIGLVSAVGGDVMNNLLMEWVGGASLKEKYGLV